jgi:hypothetical protein
MYNCNLFGILLLLLCTRLAAGGFADGTAAGNVPLAAGTAACADPLLTITAGITAGDVPLTAGTPACTGAHFHGRHLISTGDGGCTALAICGGGGCGMMAAGALGGPVALHNNKFGKVRWEVHLDRRSFINGDILFGHHTLVAAAGTGTSDAWVSSTASSSGSSSDSLDPSGRTSAALALRCT